MKLLKIDNNQGYFLTDSEEYRPVDKLTKSDLLKLVEWTLSVEVEFDQFEEAAIQNQAHQIIYKSVYQKLSELAIRKQEFTDESERLYLQDYEKYVAGASAESGA